MPADSSSKDIKEIIEKVPLDGHEPVERPEIKMLPAVERASLLMWRQPAENAEVDVGVMARDIDIGVVEHPVLPVPQIGTTPDAIERQRHQLVDPRSVRVGLMSAVVLD